MRSVASVLRLPGSVLALSRWGQACGGLAAHSRQLSSDSSDEDLPVPAELLLSGFDAAEEGAPVAVHQLIGDPRTGVADDTTTSPWGADVSMEWVWSHPATGVDWFRYSMAGPDQLPHMYMDARLSDHSKNLMYLLRCKDPERWTIPELADKFRIRRQRVMAILALKEMQAHRLEQGQDMKGPLQPYVFRVPLQDFQVTPDGEPVDLAQLVLDATEQQLQAAAAASSSSSSQGGAEASSAAAADGLGSLDDFLAPDAASSEPAAEQQPDALSSLSAAAGGQAADLAVLMPQLALTAQQLQLELLQLLQQHHYSIPELQRRLLQQIDVAEAYYNAHVAGTPLEQQLLAGFKPSKKKKAAAKEGSDEADSAAAVERPAWLDFGKQRQEVQQLLGVLAPLLHAAGPQQEREAGRLLAALKHALHEAAAAAPAAGGEAAAEQQQQPEAGSDAAAGIAALVKSAEAATFAAAFNQLDVGRRQQLLDLMPEARILLNVQGTDLRAALAGSSSSSSSDAQAGHAATSLTAAAAAAPSLWPGQVPPVVDVWGYEEVPRQQLAALQKQLPPLQQLLGQLQAACVDLGSSSSSSSSGAAAVDAEDMLALQNAAQVYSGLVWEYDKVLGEQAAAATGAADGELPPLPPQSQRRLMRILRALDGNALEKLLLWESYLREEGWEGRSNPRARRLLRRVHAAIKALDAQAAEQGLPTPFAEYPDLPADVPDYMRVDKDMATAHLDAEVVGRQFHRGSGDRHYVRLQSYPSFEGYSLEEFDSIQEGELSTISRLAAEREDNMMWKEFRERLLRNIGLTAPDLYQHLNKARPPRPRRGWSYVVHPMGGASRALIKQQLREQKVQQWLPDDDAAGSSGRGRPGDLGLALDPARDAAPAEPYVAVPGEKERKMPGWKRLPAKPKIRGLNEEEEMVVGFSRAKPRRRWYASTRGMVR